VDTKAITKEYWYNGEFECTLGGSFFREETGEIHFPEPPVGAVKEDKTYRTHLGYGCLSKAIIYGNTNFNVRYGLRRITSLKFSPESGKDKQMAKNQAKFIAEHSELITKLAECYEEYFL
jgi:hypothetical protein